MTAFPDYFVRPIRLRLILLFPFDPEEQDSNVLAYFVLIFSQVAKLVVAPLPTSGHEL